jgi:N-acyl homoserine lactone hydrolase
MVQVEVHGIPRGYIRADKNYHLEADTVATASNPNPTLERRDVPVYNLVIDHPDGVILWDTGSHHEAGEGRWPEWLYEAMEHKDANEHRLDDELEKIGYSIDDIDYVFQSHLHMDHAGGLEFFDGKDTPIFVHEEELKYAYYSVKTGDGDPGYVLSDFDHDLNWEIVHLDKEQYFEGIEFLRLPGHTIGTMVMIIHDDQKGTLILGSDILEMEHNYMREIPPGPGIAWSRDDWYESLRTIKDLQRRHGADIFFGHEPDQIDEILEGW